jgi:hypothetical protein
MPSKKRKTSKQTKSKKPTAKRAKTVRGKKTSAKASKSKKPIGKKRPKKKTAATRAVRSKKTQRRSARRSVSAQTRQDELSGRQSGDLQGLSRSAGAESESVDELVEEGNAFEAGAVTGVEEADDADEREVHTHEVPEDDVPEEYLDRD